jgi:pimeloyl-ACP methyl ester carboxylesterase
MCNLIHARSEKEPRKGPVLLVHGAGVRANIFRAPVETTLVDTLLAAGYDVWLENWRASIDFPPNTWTLDQAARFDHPEAVNTVVARTGQDRVKAVIHCQGSTSFMMSAMAGLVPRVSTIVSNAVSLHTVVPRLSELKIRFAMPLVSHLTLYLNPQWGRFAPTLTAKAIDLFVEMTHHECNNPVCKEVSFTYGSGWPALWSHENLNDATHDWLKDEFAHVPLSFFEQMARCIRMGHLVANEDASPLPRDFIAQPPRTEARIAFLAGADNHCFLPIGQVRSFRFFDRQRPGFHALHVLPKYGHLDVFMGRHAARDTFPLILAELDKTP